MKKIYLIFVILTVEASMPPGPQQNSYFATMLKEKSLSLNDARSLLGNDVILFGIEVRSTQKNDNWQEDKEKIQKTFSGIQQLLQSSDFAQRNAPIGQALKHYLQFLPSRNSIETLITTNGFENGTLTSNVYGHHINPRSWQEDKSKESVALVMQIWPQKSVLPSEWQELIKKYTGLVDVVAVLNSDNKIAQDNATIETTKILKETLTARIAKKIDFHSGIAD